MGCGTSHATATALQQPAKIANTEAKVHGNLTIKVLRGWALYNVATVGQMSPYAELWFDPSSNHKMRTKSIANGHWDPIFNESVTFVLNGKERVLHIRLRDDTIGNDKIIGQCDLDLKLLKNGEAQRFYVYDPDNVGENTYPSRGEIEIQTYLAMGEGRTPEPRNNALALPIMEGKSRPIGQLRLDVLRARNLKNSKLAGEIVGFVELWMNEQKYKSDGIKNAGTEPVWNQHFTFNLNGGDTENQVHLQLYDWNDVVRTTIGRLNIDLRQLHHDATWYHLYDSDTEIRGEIQLAASFRDRKEIAASLPGGVQFGNTAIGVGTAAASTATATAPNGDQVKPKPPADAHQGEHKVPEKVPLGHPTPPLVAVPAPAAAPAPVAPVQPPAPVPTPAPAQHPAKVEANGPYVSPPRNDGKAQPSGRFHISAHNNTLQLGVFDGRVVASKFKTQAEAWQITDTGSGVIITHSSGVDLSASDIEGKFRLETKLDQAVKWSFDTTVGGRYTITSAWGTLTTTEQGFISLDELNPTPGFANQSWALLTAPLPPIIDSKMPEQSPPLPPPWQPPAGVTIPNVIQHVAATPSSLQSPAVLAANGAPAAAGNGLVSTKTHKRGVSSVSGPSIECLVQCRGHAMASVTHGSTFAGTRGESRPATAFALWLAGINKNDVDLEYMAHVEGDGDLAWGPSGTHHRSTQVDGGRVEGFAVRLVGPKADQYHVHYMAHLANQGDTPEYTNGDFCGTRGQGRAIEGLRVWITRKL